MKRYLIAGFSILIVACNSGVNDIKPDSYLSAAQQDSFKQSVIHYVAKMPKKANHENKKDSAFAEYYDDQAEKFELKNYWVDKKSGYNYFLLTRTAPSLAEKFVSTGGRLLYSAAKDSIVEYEEIFRTWKMPKEELDKISEMLFREMIAGKDLSRYYPENSGEEYIIEFPGNGVVFDKAQRRWITR